MNCCGQNVEMGLPLAPHLIAVYHLQKTERAPEVVEMRRDSSNAKDPIFNTKIFDLNSKIRNPKSEIFNW
jgi:hypothetical protein